MEVSKTTLMRLATLGDKWGYNRQLELAEIAALPNDATGRVVGTMPHSHRDGQPCDVHMRLFVEIGGDDWTVDVPYSVWETLQGKALLTPDVWFAMANIIQQSWADEEADADGDASNPDHIFHDFKVVAEWLGILPDEDEDEDEDEAD